MPVWSSVMAEVSISVMELSPTETWFAMSISASTACSSPAVSWLMYPAMLLSEPREPMSPVSLVMVSGEMDGICAAICALITAASAPAVVSSNPTSVRALASICGGLLSRLIAEVS